jgi:hypothetical protein
MDRPRDRFAEAAMTDAIILDVLDAMTVVAKKRKRLTEKQAILRGIMSSPNVNPRWRSAIIAECQRPGRYSAVRVAEAVRAQIEHERIVASAFEYSATVRKGPRGRRPLSADTIG